MVSSQRNQRDVLRFTGAPAEACHLVSAAAIDGVGIERIGSDISIFNGADRDPISKGDLTKVTTAGDADGSAFLLPAAEAIRKCRSDADVVELRRRLVVPGAPRLAVVERDDRSLVAAEEDDVRVFGVDPDVLVVVASWSSAKRGPSFSTVGRAHRDDAGAIHDVGIVWIDSRNRQISAADQHDRARTVG